MNWLEINYSQPLNGSITIPGSKNSSLALLAACCLATQPVILKNVPNILDIDVFIEIANSIGMNVTRTNNSIIVDAAHIYSSDIDPVKSMTFRTAYYFVGALLAKHKKVCVGFPGGDNIGPRPIDQHIKGLNALGARFTFHSDHYIVEADSLTGTEIYFDVITSGATINLILAAVLAKGKTILHNAARDPEVVDLAIMLNKMGAKIVGAGTDTIRIEGVSELGGCSHTVIPDRLVAGAFLMAAGITGGKVQVSDVIPEHLESCLSKLTEIGLHIEKTDTTITSEYVGKLRPTRIRTGMYPIFATDLQQPITSLLLKAEGRSTICDKIFPQRFNHCDQLKRMGADISIRSGIARINSFRPLKGTWVHANDIRAGISLILAGLMAEGTTYITGVQHIERGYEDIVTDLNSMGANIRMCTGEPSHMAVAGFKV